MYNMNNNSNVGLTGGKNTIAGFSDQNSTPQSLKQFRSLNQTINQANPNAKIRGVEEKKAGLQNYLAAIPKPQNIDSAASYLPDAKNFMMQGGQDNLGRINQFLSQQVNDPKSTSLDDDVLAQYTSGNQAQFAQLLGPGAFGVNNLDAMIYQQTGAGRKQLGDLRNLAAQVSQAEASKQQKVEKSRALLQLQQDTLREEIRRMVEAAKSGSSMAEQSLRQQQIKNLQDQMDKRGVDYQFIQNNRDRLGDFVTSAGTGVFTEDQANRLNALKQAIGMEGQVNTNLINTDMVGFDKFVSDFLSEKEKTKQEEMAKKQAEQKRIKEREEENKRFQREQNKPIVEQKKKELKEANKVFQAATAPVRLVNWVRKLF